ncbi:MAG: hypothetical protein F6K41_10140 [Symploca sp. SIO3E6]|nr:hypothetical protein [Caldora sp. SIO3E6]
MSYILALVIGLGSFAFYMAAFFFPEVHRKSDFYSSGGGLFYALVLWVCAGRFTGWVLLSQIASVVLLCWLGWQTLTLRRMLTSPEQQTPIPSQDKLPGVLQPVTNFLGNLLGKSKSAISTPPAEVGTSQDKTAVEKEAIIEEVQETTEVKISKEEDTIIDSPFETVAVVEQEPEVPTQEDTVIDSPFETVAVVEQEPEVPTEETDTVIDSSPETVAAVEQEPEISTQEDTVIDSSPETVAAVEQEPEVSTEETDTVIDSSPETVAAVEQEPEISTQEDTVIDSSPETVAAVEQEPEVSTEEKDTVIDSSSETIAAVEQEPEVSTEKDTVIDSPSETPTATVTSPEKAESNISSKKKQGFVQQVTGLFRKSKPVTPIVVNKQKSRGKVNDAAQSSMAPVVDDTKISETVETVTTESSEAEISETVEPITAESSEADTSEKSETTTNTELSASNLKQNKKKKKAKGE